MQKSHQSSALGIGFHLSGLCLSHIPNKIYIEKLNEDLCLSSSYKPLDLRRHDRLDLRLSLKVLTNISYNLCPKK